MPQSYYNISSPGIFLSKINKVEQICHNHHSSIPNSEEGLLKKRSLRQIMDHQQTLVTGCMTFFKSYALTAEDPEVKAYAEAAAAEDEARLKELKKHRPSACQLF